MRPWHSSWLCFGCDSVCLLLETSFFIYNCFSDQSELGCLCLFIVAIFSWQFSHRVLFGPIFDSWVSWVLHLLISFSDPNLGGFHRLFHEVQPRECGTAVWAFETALTFEEEAYYRPFSLAPKSSFPVPLTASLLLQLCCNNTFSRTQVQLATFREQPVPF